MCLINNIFAVTSYTEMTWFKQSWPWLSAACLESKKHSFLKPAVFKTWLSRVLSAKHKKEGRVNDENDEEKDTQTKETEKHKVWSKHIFWEIVVKRL